MSTGRFKSRVPLASAVLVLGLSVAACGRDDGPAAQPTPGSSAARSEIRKQFPVLAEARTPADTFPLKAAPSQSRSGGASLKNPLGQANLDQSRKALETIDGNTVYLVPTEASVCAVLVTGNPDQAVIPGCSDRSRLDAQTSAEPAQANVDCTGDGKDVPTCKCTILFGLAPRGINRATARLPDGRSVEGKVANNAYAVELDGSPAPADVELQANK